MNTFSLAVILSRRTRISLRRLKWTTSKLLSNHDWLFISLLCALEMTIDRHGPDQKMNVLTICNHLYLDNFFMTFNIIQCWMIVVHWSLYRTRTNNIILDDSDLVWIAGTSHVNLATTKMVFFRFTVNNILVCTHSRRWFMWFVTVRW